MELSMTNEQFRQEFEAFMDALCEPLGDYAPKKHTIYVDYQEDGVDMHTILQMWFAPGGTEQKLVTKVFDLLNTPNRKVTGMTEPAPGGFYVYYLDAEAVLNDNEKGR